MAIYGASDGDIQTPQLWMYRYLMLIIIILMLIIDDGSCSGYPEPRKLCS